MCLRKFFDHPESSPVEIFARDHFLSSSFGLIVVLVRFHAIPGLSNNWLARARGQISQSSHMRTRCNFHAQSLPIFVIWPNYGTCAISCDSVTASFLLRSRTQPNSLALQGVNRLQFSCATASNIRHFVQLGYLCDFARSREGQYFSVCVNFLNLPGGFQFEFSCAIASLLHHLA